MYIFIHVKADIMDDPLVALSLWQSQPQNGGKKSKNSSQHKSSKSKLKTKENKWKNRRDPSGGQQSTFVTGTEHIDLDEATGGEMLKDDSHKTSNNSPSKSDNCFPCLPGIEIDQSRTNRSKQVEDSPRDNRFNGGTDGYGVDILQTNHMDNACLDSNILSSSPFPHIQSYWLLRLFQSNLFTMDIAIQYLYKEKDPDVQNYLGKKLFVSFAIKSMIRILFNNY